MYLVSCILYLLPATNTCKRNVLYFVVVLFPSPPRAHINIYYFVYICRRTNSFFPIYLFSLCTAFLNLAIPLHLLRLCFIPFLFGPSSPFPSPPPTAIVLFSLHPRFAKKWTKEVQKKGVRICPNRIMHHTLGEI